MNPPLKDDPDRWTAELLSGLKEVSERDPNLAAQGRSLYLEQARELRKLKLSSRSQNSSTEAVSILAGFRLNEWLSQLFRPFTERRQPIMLNILLALIISSALVLGGGGAAVFASQDSLPDEPLYGVKTWSEDLSLGLTASPQQKMEMAMNYVDRRLMEMAQTKQAGSDIQPETEERLQYQLRYALQLAGGLSDEEILPALTRLRTRLEQQTRQMQMLQDEHPNDPTLERARQQLQEQVRAVELGLEDPLKLRQQLHSRSGQVEIPEEEPAETEPIEEQPQGTPEPNSYGIGPNQPTNPVQEGFGPGPQLSGTPAVQPGQYGPGPNQPEATPQGGFGPGPGPNEEPPSDPVGPLGPKGPAEPSATVEPPATGGGNSSGSSANGGSGGNGGGSGGNQGGGN